jgi:hypothetical protein
MAALRLDPNGTEMVVYFGFLFGDGGVSDRDIATLHSEANTHTNDPVPHLVLGLALHASRDTKGAFAEFETVRKLGLDNAFLRRLSDPPVHEARDSQFAGKVHTIDKDKSTIAITRANREWQVVYNSDTKWMYGTQESNKPSSLDELKENWFISCRGRFGSGKLFASTCHFRESN